MTRTAVGTHEVRVLAEVPACPSCDFYPHVEYGRALATVVAGQPNSVDVALDENVGVVAGSLTVNGTGASDLAISLGGVRSVVGAAPFDLFLPAGTYQGTVSHEGLPIGTLSFDVTTGEMTDLGVVDFTYPGQGTLKLTVTWHGFPALGGGLSMIIPAADERASIYTDDGTSPRVALVNGTYDVFVGVCSTPADYVAQTVVSVDGDTDVTLDLAPTAGSVTGTLAVDGQPLSSPHLQIFDPASCPGWAASSSGEFSRYLLPGTYVLHVLNPQSYLGSVTFTVVAGETTDLGVVELEPPPVTDLNNACQVTGESEPLQLSNPSAHLQRKSAMESMRIVMVL